MAGIVLGPEKLHIAHLEFRRTDDDAMWWFRFPYLDYEAEALLAGDDGGPNPDWLDLAVRVSAQLDKFVPEATNYLRSFMGNSHRSRYGNWSLEWLEFGRDLHVGLRWPFELVFLQDGDTYGGWSVLFADAGEPVGYWPRQFRRFER